MILTLVLKKEWFDKIKNGEKNIEYREVKPFWNKRLNKKFKTIKFKNGYRKDAPVLIADFDFITIVDGINTDLKHNGYVYAIIFNNVREIK
jgi:hypothetical protein